MSAKPPLRLGIMQPYYFPYIGYFQLIAAVDVFVLYDNIKYTKKGWINRNRILQNGKDILFSLPLKSGSDSLDIRDKYLADNFNPTKFLRQLQASYSQAPFYSETISLVDNVQRFKSTNLFEYLANSIRCVCDHLGITTEILVSSRVPANHALKGEERVIAICEAIGATRYINSIGGISLYSRESFALKGIDLQFLSPSIFDYPQQQEAFIPWLSIIDVLMFNSIESVRVALVKNIELIRN